MVNNAVREPDMNSAFAPRLAYELLKMYDIPHTQRVLCMSS